MALIENFKTPHGVIATYHRIVSANINTERKAVEYVVSIYASPEARDAGGTPLWTEYPVVPFKALTQDPRDLLYPLLANFGDSYLKGATADEPNGAPGVFSINLKPEALEPTPPMIYVPAVESMPNYMNVPMENVVSEVPVKVVEIDPADMPPPPQEINTPI